MGSPWALSFLRVILRFFITFGRPVLDLFLGRVSFVVSLGVLKVQLGLVEVSLGTICRVRIRLSSGLAPAVGLSHLGRVAGRVRGRKFHRPQPNLRCWRDSWRKVIVGIEPDRARQVEGGQFYVGGRTPRGPRRHGKLGDFPRRIGGNARRMRDGGGERCRGSPGDRLPRLVACQQKGHENYCTASQSVRQQVRPARLAHSLGSSADECSLVAECVRSVGNSRGSSRQVLRLRRCHPVRVEFGDRRPMTIPKPIHPIPQPNRIRRRPPPQPRCVVPHSMALQPRLFIPFHPRIPIPLPRNLTIPIIRPPRRTPIRVVFLILDAGLQAPLGVPPPEYGRGRAAAGRVASDSLRSVRGRPRTEPSASLTRGGASNGLGQPAPARGPHPAARSGTSSRQTAVAGSTNVRSAENSAALARPSSTAYRTTTRPCR